MLISNISYRYGFSQPFELAEMYYLFISEFAIY
jgi:hypothetical protein